MQSGFGNEGWDGAEDTTGEPAKKGCVRLTDFSMDIEETDKQWRISTETLIRAKSVKGYRTNNRKWTENKFKVRLALELIH